MANLSMAGNQPQLAKHEERCSGMHVEHALLCPHMNMVFLIQSLCRAIGLGFIEKKWLY
jgi:hypothetical protein